VPVVVLQHISPGFTNGLADWLNTQCQVPVQVAVEGARVAAGGIYIAPTGHHLVIRGRSLAFSEGPNVSGHCPSVTVLFESVAREYGSAAIGVLLTGMGRDGAAGLRELKEAGATTLAQDEASSVVFGMPAAAIELGVVDHVASPEAIGQLLNELASTRRDRPAR
jgi:two-component system chemotaxis response regulator CheB